MNTNLTQTNLTPRQWATYNLIKNNTELGKITTINEIIDNYPYSIEQKDGYKRSANPKSHDICSQVWADIQDINFSQVIQKQVVIKNFTYKLSESIEETREFVDRTYYRPAMKKLVRRSNLMRKAHLDGQGKIKFDNESQAREYYESFAKRIVEELMDYNNDRTTN